LKSESPISAAPDGAAPHTFFLDYLYEGKPIDFAAYLHLLGLRIHHDQLLARDPQGRPLHTRQDFQSALRTLHIGDTALVQTIPSSPHTAGTTTQKKTGTNTVPVHISSYTTPLITIAEDPAATPRQKHLFRAWSSGAPR